MKKFTSATLIFLLGFAILPFSGCVSPLQRTASPQKAFFQTSTINALLAGVYDGNTTFKTLSQHGNMGLGTVNCLDGEMIGLDGKFYQIKTDGKAYRIADTAKTPFAEVVFFKPDTAFKITDSIKSYEQLKSVLEKQMPAKNIFYAFRIDGTFTYIKTRSVPGQHKPYPPLTEVVKHQKVFEFHQVKGTLIGFWCPDYIKGINVPEFHFHFITSDHKAGGHVLACRMQNVQVKMEKLTQFYMVLSESRDFNKTNLSGDKQKQLEKVEKGQ